MKLIEMFSIENRDKSQSSILNFITIINKKNFESK